MRVRTHVNPFSLNKELKPLNLVDLFQNSKSELDVEIGFGRGVFLRHWAKLYPDHNVLGAEVRKPMVDILEERLIREEISNVYLVHARGEALLEQGLADDSIQRVFLFHPDPWFKARHQKRRVIQSDFLSLLHKKMKKNGVIYVSTDVETLFQDMMAHFFQFSAFEPFEDDFWSRVYLTHWDDFSQKEARSLFKCAFKKTL